MESKSNTSGAPRDNKTGEDKRGKKFRKRTCKFCENKEVVIDYKRIDILVRFVSNKGKILPRRLSGNCAKHQRLVAKEIKKARTAGLMPFTVK